MTIIDDICRTVGAIIVNFNSTELLLRRLVWFLVDAENPEKGKAVTKKLMVQGVIDIGFSLVKAMDLKKGKEIKEILKKCASATEERNEVAHTYFCIPNEAKDLSEIYTKWPQHYKKGEFFGNDEPLDHQKLKELNEKINSLSDDLSKLLEEIGAGVTFGNA